MKVGIFSDLHLKKGGKKIQGWDKKLTDCLYVLRQIVDIFVNKNVDMFVFLGDFYEMRYVLDVQAVTAVIDIMSSLKNVEGYFIPGNHDLYYRSEGSIWVNSLYMYSLRWNVVDDIMVVNDMIMMPYFSVISDDTYRILNDLADSSKILFMHQFIKGMPVQGGYCIQGDDVFDPVMVKKLKWVFAGHLHVPAVLNFDRMRLVSVGAPMEHDFSDSGSVNRGCIIYDSDSDDIEWFYLDYPRYYIVKSVDEIKDDDNYYEIVVNEKEMINLTHKDNVTVKVVVEEKSIDRLGVGDKWGWKDLIEKYVLAKNVDKKDSEILKNIAFDILSEVGLI